MIPPPPPDSNAPLDQFFQRVWTTDVQPLLRGEMAGQRAAVARLGGKAAAASGRALDTLFGFKGRPFTRSLTVLGASFGAMLPDLWDWAWLCERISHELRARVDAQVQRRARELELAEALALFGLTTRASPEDLKRAWRAASLQWHPDVAPVEKREEYHTRFVAFQAAYERLLEAFESTALPR